MAAHFEEVWTEAEKVSTKQYQHREELYLKLGQEIQELKKLDLVPSAEIKKVLKTKKLGEILLMITALTRLDEVNSWAALQQEIQIIEKLNS